MKMSSFRGWRKRIHAEISRRCGWRLNATTFHLYLLSSPGSAKERLPRLQVSVQGLFHPQRPRRPTAGWPLCLWVLLFTGQRSSFICCHHYCHTFETFALNYFAIRLWSFLRVHTENKTLYPFYAECALKFLENITKVALKSTCSCSLYLYDTAFKIVLIVFSTVALSL